MDKVIKLFTILVLLIPFSSQADEGLKRMFSKKYSNKQERSLLKAYTLKLGGDAVPTLIEVMKTSSYPDDNRWMATFLLGQIMGKDSAPFIAKFLKHPKWFMRLASLKSLLVLKQSGYKVLYAKALRDPSMIVRAQALDNITEMDLQDVAPSVWSMLYDESNYAGAKKALKRTQIIRDAVMAVGHLKYDKAKPALLKMINNKDYSDIFVELDYALSKLTGKKSPDHRGAKQIYWKKYAVTEQIII